MIRQVEAGARHSGTRTAVACSMTDGSKLSKKRQRTRQHLGLVARVMSPFFEISYFEITILSLPVLRGIASITLLPRNYSPLIRMSLRFYDRF